MRSELAERARRDLLDRARRMPAAERLKAFAEICRWVARIAEAGRRRRAPLPR